MKGIILVISLSIVFLSDAQTIRTLKRNNLNIRLSSNGSLPDSAGTAAIFLDNGFSLALNCGVWMSATDSAGNIRLAVMDAFGNGDEFWPGPLQVQNEVSANPNEWDKVYPASKEQINYHIQNYRNQGYSLSNELAEWPGSVPAPYAGIIAPFVDNGNNDRIYSPANGDYPYIRSEEVLLSVSNDRYLGHTVSNSLPLGIELHTTLMAFDDSALKNCVLVRYSVFNRSNRNYENFRLSGVTDFKIGNTTNEYLGTHVGQRALFAFNDTSEATFGGKLVSLGCMAINNRISSTIYYENSTDPVNGTPVIDTHYYRLMQGLWKNGNPMKYGGNGVDASGSEAHFVYPYLTDPEHTSVSWNDNERYQPGRRTALINFDSISLKRGEARNFDLLYFYVEEKSTDIQQIGKSCLEIKQVLSTRNLLKIGQTEYNYTPDLKVWPNPVKAGGKLHLGVSSDDLQSVEIISLNGVILHRFDLENFNNNIILPDELIAGIYMLKIQKLNTIEYKKLLIQHQ